jgi:hypothetical protein
MALEFFYHGECTVPMFLQYDPRFRFNLPVRKQHQGKVAPDDKSDRGENC